MTASVPTPPLPIQITADERATRIDALQQQLSLGRLDVEELLAACMDTRTTTKETWQKLMKLDEVYSAGTVGAFAWKQLSQSWSMDAGAEMFVVQALDDKNALVCAAAAWLLQSGKKLTVSERKRAAEKIMVILRDEELSRRPLDVPGDSSRVWRLDDVLFEALRVLVE